MPGAVVWTRNAATDTGAKLPGWGYTASPLIVEDKVVVATSGRMAAYDLATGDKRWFSPAAGGSYSSPQRVVEAPVGRHRDAAARHDG